MDRQECLSHVRQECLSYVEQAFLPVHAKPMDRQECLSHVRQECLSYVENEADRLLDPPRKTYVSICYFADVALACAVNRDL